MGPLDGADDCGVLLILEPSSIFVTVPKSADGSIELQVSARLVNHGPKALTLVMPGDGSMLGLRTPIISWSFTPTIEHPAARCGNITTLAPGEVFTLQVGESRELPQSIRPYLRGGGVYRAHITYSNEPSLQWAGEPLGDHDATEMARVRSSDRCRVRSNEIVVTVEQ